MNPQLIIAAVIAAMSFTGGWTIQSWRYGAKEKARAEQQLVQQQQAAAVAIRQADNVIEAQSAATTRLVKLRNDAAGSRAALVSLSDASATALQDAAASKDACVVRATAFSELLGQCAGSYRSLAEKADGHASDVKMLVEGWPR